MAERCVHFEHHLPIAVATNTKKQLINGETHVEFPEHGRGPLLSELPPPPPPPTGPDLVHQPEIFGTDNSERLFGDHGKNLIWDMEVMIFSMVT